MGISLHHSVLGQGPNVVLLHGLFAQGSNLGMVARGLKDEFSVHSPDLPDHGRSGWVTNGSIPCYAEAICHWMDSQGLQSAHFIGHSLGGKVAMQIALNEPHRVDALVVGDIAPVAYKPSHQVVFAGMAAVARAGCESRRDAARILRESLAEEAVVQFLLLSLGRQHNGCYDWRLNREGLEANYSHFLKPPAGDRPFDGRTLFLRGALSDYVLDAHRPMMEKGFPHSIVETVADTGHWLHAEQTQFFNDRVLRFLL